MPTITAVADQIIAEDLPALFVDTCILLDVIRSIKRKFKNCVIDPDNECSGRAINRVIHNVPPSKKGGEAKDCTILEECLAVARRLHVSGFQKKRVFCTSNTTDYCELSSIHPLLAAEFAPINLAAEVDLPHGSDEG